MAAQQDIAQRAFNKVVLGVVEELLYAQADLINALMRDGVAPTKLVLGGTAPPIMPPQGGV